MRILASSLIVIALCTAPALAANSSSKESGNSSEGNSARPAPVRSVGQSAGRIATQPARDVGVAKTNIPPVLQAAAADPYSLKGIKTCRDISAAFHALTDVIGPDLQAGVTKKENRAGKLAEAGGKTVVNSIIPFRGLVREVTGAAPAQRRFERAVASGYARRGFLRGVHQTRKCKTKLF